ncbi:MAG TPA: hypothetical protein VFG05_11595 [Methylocella sp.]|nr:hypothetical protein [Methylocella sp.]
MPVQAAQSYTSRCEAIMQMRRFWFGFTEGQAARNVRCSVISMVSWSAIFWLPIMISAAPAGPSIQTRRLVCSPLRSMLKTSALSLASYRGVMAAAVFCS